MANRTPAQTTPEAEQVLGTPDKAITETEEYRSMQAYFWNNFPAVAEDNVEVNRQIVTNILSTNVDDIFDMAETLDSAMKWSHKPIMVHGIDAVMPSKYGGIYVRINLSLLHGDGEIHRVNIGSPTLLAQLAVLSANDRLPFECKIVPISGGGKEGRNPPLYFRRLDY